jgi:hypothetical protein
VSCSWTMHSSTLSQAQGCLRLQSVFRAHRTRRCITHRSRLEFESILAELEGESSPSHVVFPLPFLCRPQMQRHNVPAIATPAAAVQHNPVCLASLPSTPSSLSASSILSSPLQVGRSYARAAGTSPPSSAPASPSAPLPAHTSDAAARGPSITDDFSSATVLTACADVSAAGNEGRASPLHVCSHSQRQDTQAMPRYFDDASQLVRPATADACVGDDDSTSSLCFQEHGSSRLQCSLSCHEHSFEDDCSSGDSDGGSPCSRSDEASRVSVNIPLSPSSPVHLHFAEQRFFFLFDLALVSPSHSTQLQIASRLVRRAARPAIISSSFERKQPWLHTG